MSGKNGKVSGPRGGSRSWNEKTTLGDRSEWGRKCPTDTPFEMDLGYVDVVGRPGRTEPRVVIGPR